jgi:hypothetical protein
VKVHGITFHIVGLQGLDSVKLDKMLKQLPIKLKQIYFNRLICNKKRGSIINVGVENNLP